QAREAARSAGRPEVPDPSRLWYLEPRTDVARWLTERGWEVSTITAVDLMASHQRQAPEELSELVPDTTFVEAQKL
ncbi:MAG TPA: SAM-dependent methyltransferase, partial [Mycobacterium sp.]|nr:SAM-dependent methyltransferase [Mycobacterium sp.]